MKRYGFLGGKEAINSLRSSGYKDTSMAIGELIDNSIQAEANKVTIVLTTEYYSGQRTTRRIIEVAVIDNGHGMNSEDLQESLVLGEGKNRNEKHGMGKFGVGLPQSSISQAKRIDAWSWKKDRNKTKHAYIDLNDDEWLNDAEIKIPDDMPVPEKYKQFIDEYESGTIIQWSDLDRISWKKENTVFEKCQNQIGRMYRYWLNDGKVKIKLITIENNGKKHISHDFQAVDPLFLMNYAKCGNPPEKPMFKEFRVPIDREYDVIVNGEKKKARVVMKFSIAKENVRILDEGVAGSKDFGKIAKDCMGISIVREERELELNNQWNISDAKDPRHRWWGVEISFDRNLDEVFGVTNNKQSATKLNEIAKKDWKEICEEFDIDDEDESRSENLLKNESPNDYVLMDVVTTVRNIIAEMDKLIQINTRKNKKDKATRYDKEESVPQEKYDMIVKHRSDDSSKRSETDVLVEECNGDRVTGIKEIMADNGEYDKGTATKIIDDVKKGHRCSIIVSAQDSSSFFNIAREDTHMVIKLNSGHPMYDQVFGIFVDILNDSTGNVDDVKIKAKDAFDTIQFLLAAWARMEDEDRDPNKKRQYRQIREKWGEILEDSAMLEKENE